MVKLRFAGTVTTPPVSVALEGEFRVPGFIAADVGLDELRDGGPCPKNVRDFIVRNLPGGDAAWKTVRYAGEEGPAGRAKAEARGIRFDDGPEYRLDRVTVDSEASETGQEVRRADASADASVEARSAKTEALAKAEAAAYTTETWTCFHCGGPTPPHAGGCVLKLEGGDVGLLAALRAAEEQRDEIRRLRDICRDGAREILVVAHYLSVRLAARRKVDAGAWYDPLMRLRGDLLAESEKPVAEPVVGDGCRSADRQD